MKKILPLLLIFLSIQSLKAQEWAGYVLSNYAGVHAVLFNPAEIADNRLALDINLAGASVSFDNSYIGLHKAGFFANKLTKGISEDASFDELENEFSLDAWDKNKTHKVA